MQLMIYVCLLSNVLFCNSLSSYSAVSCIISYARENSVLNNVSWLSNRNLTRFSTDALDQTVSFKLYTRVKPNGETILYKSGNSLENSSFIPNAPTRILTHGFNGRCSHSACMGPARAFLKKGNFNIITIDWYEAQIEGNIIPNYFKAVKVAKEVGLYIAKMIDFLVEHGMNPDTTAMIGHSLGAHTIGIAGYHASYKINHIIGLDAAEPLFANKGPGDSISKEDAAHVELIHTNAGHCGLAEAVGHYDFYPNSGSKQPQCTKNSCSHGRSVEYYIESLESSTGFYGRRCNDKNSIGKEYCIGEVALMGGVERSALVPGVYFVETNDASPFAKGP